MDDLQGQGPPCLVELNLANNDIRDAGSLVDDVPTEAHIWCIWENFMAFHMTFQCFKQMLDGFLNPRLTR